jgi:hypothetical protein
LQGPVRLVVANCEMAASVPGNVTTVGSGHLVDDGLENQPSRHADLHPRPDVSPQIALLQHFGSARYRISDEPGFVDAAALHCGQHPRDLLDLVLSVPSTLCVPEITGKQVYANRRYNDVFWHPNKLSQIKYCFSVWLIDNWWPARPGRHDPQGAITRAQLDEPYRSGVVLFYLIIVCQQHDSFCHRLTNEKPVERVFVKLWERRHFECMLCFDE